MHEKAMNSIYRARAARAMTGCQSNRLYVIGRLPQIATRRQSIMERYAINDHAALQAIDSCDAERRATLSLYRSYINELHYANRGLALACCGKRLP